MAWSLTVSPSVALSMTPFTCSAITARLSTWSPSYRSTMSSRRFMEALEPFALRACCLDAPPPLCSRQPARCGNGRSRITVRRMRSLRRVGTGASAADVAGVATAPGVVAASLAVVFAVTLAVGCRRALARCAGRSLWSLACVLRQWLPLGSRCHGGRCWRKPSYLVARSALEVEDGEEDRAVGVEYVVKKCERVPVGRPGWQDLADVIR